MKIPRVHIKVVFGCLAGFVITFAVFEYGWLTGTRVRKTLSLPMSFENITRLTGNRQSSITPVLTQVDLERIQQIIQLAQPKDDNHHHDNMVAHKLAEKVRILCWILTCPDNLDKKAKHVRDTWGKRCNILLFISSVQNDSFPTIGFNLPEGRSHLTAKTMLAFRHIYQNYFDKADWFMKADDDTYVIVENVRYFLSDQNTNDPVYFGHHFKANVRQGYFSGGGGYIISKEALRRYGSLPINNSICAKDGGSEDSQFGRCMESLGVRVGNSTDSLGRSRFHCFKPETHVAGRYPDWYYKYDANGAHKGEASMSDYAISFHYISPTLMHTIDFLIYQLQPYGISYGPQELNQNTSLISRYLNQNNSAAS